MLDRLIFAKDALVTFVKWAFNRAITIIRFLLGMDEVRIPVKQAVMRLETSRPTNQENPPLEPSGKNLNILSHVEHSEDTEDTDVPSLKNMAFRRIMTSLYGVLKKDFAYGNSQPCYSHYYPYISDNTLNAMVDTPSGREYLITALFKDLSVDTKKVLDLLKGVSTNFANKPTLSWSTVDDILFTLYKESCAETRVLTYFGDDQPLSVTDCYDCIAVNYATFPYIKEEDQTLRTKKSTTLMLDPIHLFSTLIRLARINKDHDNNLKIRDKISHFLGYSLEANLYPSIPQDQLDSWYILLNTSNQESRLKMNAKQNELFERVDKWAKDNCASYNWNGYYEQRKLAELVNIKTKLTCDHYQLLNFLTIEDFMCFPIYLSSLEDFDCSRLTVEKQAVFLAQQLKNDARLGKATIINLQTKQPSCGWKSLLKIYKALMPILADEDQMERERGMGSFPVETSEELILQIFVMYLQKVHTNSALNDHLAALLATVLIDKSSIEDNTASHIACTNVMNVLLSKINLTNTEATQKLFNDSCKEIKLSLSSNPNNQANIEEVCHKLFSLIREYNSNIQYMMVPRNDGLNMQMQLG